MALSAATVMEVRTDGSDENGGGFVSTGSGTDRSQQASPQVHIDNSAITTSITTNTITFTAGYTATSADVDNLVQMLTGTNVTAGFYRITAATSSTWTLDRNAVTSGTTVNATAKMGGSLASPGRAGGAMSGTGSVAGMQTWVRLGTYSITSTSSNVSGGRVTLSTANTRMIGYDTERGDATGVRPTFLAAVNTMTLVTISNDAVLANINLSAGAQTGILGVSSTSGALLYYVRMTGANTTAAFRGQANSHHILCEASGGTVTGFRGEGGHFYGCVAKGVAGRGFDMGSNDSTCVRCVSINHTGSAGKGFDLSTATGSAMFINCTAYGNADHGFDNSAAPAAACQWINCIAYGNSDGGFNSNGRAWNCAAGDNLTDYHANTIQIDSIVLTEDPFTSVADLDFSLNLADGGGADCRSAGIPGAFPSLITTTGHLDLGAAQHLSTSRVTSSRHILLALPRAWSVEQ